MKKRPAPSPPSSSSSSSSPLLATPVKAPKRKRQQQKSSKQDLFREDEEEHLFLRQYLSNGFRASSSNSWPDSVLIADVRAAVSDAGADAVAGCRTLHLFLAKYEVTRTFRGLKLGDPTTSLKLLPLLAHLRSAWGTTLRPLLSPGAAPTPQQCVAAVDAVADAIAGAFGSRNLCAASKLLNVLGLPAPLCDSRARAALGIKTFSTSSSSSCSPYGMFVSAWVESYEARAPRYAAAAAALLPAADDQSASSSSSSSSSPPCPFPSHPHLTTDWFLVRAHDLLLFTKGRP